jgi:pilus assembly protein Flp/PilA
MNRREEKPTFAFYPGLAIQFRPAPSVSVAADKTYLFCHHGSRIVGFIACDGYRMWRIVMKSFVSKVRQFMVSEDGPTAVEYAVMLALIVIVCLSAISTLGSNAKTTFTNVGASVAAS